MRSQVEIRGETSAAIGAVTTALGIAEGRVGADRAGVKGARDIVTETDVSIEEALAEALSEERGSHGAAAHWLVDPLCATRNFASSIPLSARRSECPLIRVMGT